MRPSVSAANASAKISQLGDTMADLCAAASSGDLTTLQAAIAQGRAINCVHEGKTPLWRAAESGHLEVCRALLAQKASLYMKQHPSADTLSALSAAVQNGHASVVACLLPHCTAPMEIRTLEKAISGGFYEIADLMLQSGIFRYPRDGTNTLPPESESLVIRHGSNPALLNWQGFLFQRRDRLASLDPVYLEYGLVLAAKAGDGGRQLIKFLIEEAGVDTNCRVWVEDDGQDSPTVLETPLCVAAARGYLGVVNDLLGYESINAALCGGYDWPPFLHLLRQSNSTSTPEGLSLLETLSSVSSIQQAKIYKSKVSCSFETVFENALQSSNEIVMKKVVDLVRGAAAGAIAPLLVRTHNRDGLAWLFCRENTLQRTSRLSWILLCDYFRESEDAEALELLVEVADTYAQWGVWDPAILMSFQTRNFSFAKQFFFDPWESEACDYSAETLQAFNKSAGNDKLIEAWETSEHANAALWYAVTSGLWRQSPEFERIVSDTRINPNMPEPDRGSKRDLKTTNINHRFIREGCHTFPAEDPIKLPCLLTDEACTQFLESLCDLNNPARQYERVRQRARQGKSLLTFGTEIGDLQLVHKVLRNPRVDVNVQDKLYKRTPLMYAVARGDGEMVAVLVARREIRVNLVDSEGRSAIFYAAQGGFEAIVGLLLKTNKVYLSVRDTKGHTALDYAKEMGHNNIISLLQARL